jgi:beta-lactam-binding protein with PASTA domain
MVLKTRVWTAGKVLLLIGAWVATYVLFAGVAMRVTLRVREVSVPDVRGRSVGEATALLSGVGLTLNVEQLRRIDLKVPAGVIMGQEPAPGQRTRMQRSVRVWLSAGPRPTRVPPLVGEPVRAAEARLAEDALTLTGVAEIRSRDYPSDTVVAQDPPPDRDGTAVTLLVNRGAPDVTFVMPDVIGVVGDRAAEILRVRGFRVAVVAEQPYPGVPPGVVLRQHPAAGFQIAPGEPISLEVSR